MITMARNGKFSIRGTHIVNPSTQGMALQTCSLLIEGSYERIG
ncbi:hypothetical protein THOG05_120134 [Vibrio rotiferianus]|uniref:Uncharacterized protein n=1 Tax=Vibrio jasicida TaxID=766224 RepID=A0AAU9QJ97_9VIBR|nr:hypothetical protein THOG05_120134 [Vibrio rotiferianus]CAH1567545.1 hypothetical protein THF1C08_150077 [Vibrio jasicida]CAH1578400.1 hypothetical protein THF1A12_150080 [Vibrio jasicida]